MTGACCWWCAADPDARTKKVTLTAKAARVADLLAVEWRATETAVAEIPYPLSRLVADIEEALRRKSSCDRLTEKLDEDPGWSRGAAAAGTDTT
jgi:hypothetical protein